MSEYLDRLSDLEADLHNANARIVELEAKLAMVKEWRGPMPYGVASGAIKDNALRVDDDFDELDALLSDTRKPLAVVEGYVWADFAEEFARYAFSVAKDQVDDFDDADSVHVPVTVIVLPKEVE